MVGNHIILLVFDNNLILIIRLNHVPNSNLGDVGLTRQGRIFERLTSNLPNLLSGVGIPIFQYKSIVIGVTRSRATAVISATYKSGWLLARKQIRQWPAPLWKFSIQPQMG